jgi:hypothetical protein
VNPFAPVAAAAAVPAPMGFGSAHSNQHSDAHNGNYEYALLRSGPEVNPDEVEQAHVASLEVMVLWDKNVLHVSHMTPPRTWTIGDEASSKDASCDFVVGSDSIGGTRAPVVVARGGAPALVIFPGSTGHVEIPGQGKFRLDELVSTGRARPSSEVREGHEFDLPPGSKARMELATGLAFQVSAVNAGKAPPAGFFSQLEPTGYMYTGLSLLLHLGILACFAFFMPKMNGDDSEAVDRDQLLLMQKMLDNAAPRLWKT